MSRFFPLPIGILCVQREKPLAVKQARHVGSLSSACQHPISHTFLAILFFLQIFCAFTKKEKVSLFKKKLLLRTARERESDLRAWWCQYRSRGGFQVEIGPPPTIFFAQRLFVGLSVVFFFLFRLPLLLFALLSFRVVGYQVVQFRCRQRHKKVQHIHPGGSFSSPRRLPRKRAHTKTKQTQLGHKEKKRKEKKRKDTHKKRVCVLVYSEERERKITQFNQSVTGFSGPEYHHHVRAGDADVPVTGVFQEGDLDARVKVDLRTVVGGGDIPTIWRCIQLYYDAPAGKRTRVERRRCVLMEQTPALSLLFLGFFYVQFGNKICPHQLKISPHLFVIMSRVVFARCRVMRAIKADSRAGAVEPISSQTKGFSNSICFLANWNYLSDQKKNNNEKERKKYL